MYRKFISLFIVTSLLAGCGTTEKKQDVSLSKDVSTQTTNAQIIPKEIIIAQLKDMLQVKPQLDEITKLFSEGKKQETFVKLEDVLKKFPDSFFVTNMALDIYGKTSSWKKGNELADKLIAQFEPKIPLLDKYALEKDTLINSYAMKAILAKKVQKDDKLALSYINKGLSLLEGQKEILSSSTPVTEQRRNLIADLYLKSAQIHEDQKQYALAVEDYTKILNYKPNTSFIYIKRFAVNTKLGNHQAAIHDLNFLMTNDALFRQTPVLLPFRALAYTSTGQEEKAQNDLKLYNEFYSETTAKIITKNGEKMFQIGNNPPETSNEMIEKAKKFQGL